MPRPAAPRPAAESAWDEQAAWYDARHGQDGDDLHRQVVLPAVLRGLAAQPGQRILDVCCGQGVAARFLAAQGLEVIGIDASPALIARARERVGAGERYEVGDARRLEACLGDLAIDHACVVLALQDLDPIEPVLAGIARRLPAGGRCVIVLVHPCFRPLRRSAWGWDAEQRVQYRRIDGYLSPAVERLRTHPGRGAASPESQSWHRPLGAYIAACAAAGLGVVRLEEPVSPRRGSPGPKAAAEDRAAREIPLFAVLVAQAFGGPA